MPIISHDEKRNPPHSREQSWPSKSFQNLAKKRWPQTEKQECTLCRKACTKLNLVVMTKKLLSHSLRVCVHNLLTISPVTPVLCRLIHGHTFGRLDRKSDKWGGAPLSRLLQKSRLNRKCTVRLQTCGIHSLAEIGMGDAERTYSAGFLVVINGFGITIWCEYSQNTCDRSK